MKKQTIIIAVLALTFCVIAIAGVVYDRSSVTIAAAGTARWTNSAAYSALELKRIWVEGNLYATNVVTITRVTSDGLYTQAVGSVACTSGSGSTATLTASFLKFGDMLNFSSFFGTNCTAIVEYEVQQH
jgi:hypothetical protein